MAAFLTSIITNAVSHPKIPYKMFQNFRSHKAAENIRTMVTSVAVFMNDVLTDGVLPSKWSDVSKTKWLMSDKGYHKR
jgi:hypothetical protein